MSLQFVSCSDVGCPMNSGKQCRAPFIFVDADGRCSIKANGPYDNKAAIESYVDLKTCDCERCDHWEQDNQGKGVCGFRADLFFGPGNICHEFDKQIGQPGYVTLV